MKLVPIFLLLSAVSAAAQQKPVAVLVDEMGRPCNEELLARFDNFIQQQNQFPGATSYIYLYGDDELEGGNLSFAGYLGRGYYRLKDYPERQFRFVRGGNVPEMKIQFWLVPPGAERPKVSPVASADQVLREPMLFDKGFADFQRWYGKLGIYEMGFYDLGCDFPPNVEAFAQHLKKDPKLHGQVVVFTKKGYGRKRANAVARFALADIRKRFRVPSKQLSFTYGGIRKEPEIELWLIPSGTRRPTK